MGERQRVAQFVDRLFQKPFPQNRRIRGQAIKFLAQAVKGDHGARPVQLRLAKNKRQDRNVQIDSSDPENALVT